MRRIGIFVLAALLLLCMAACEKDKDDDKKSSETGNTLSVSAAPEDDVPEKGGSGEDESDEGNKPEPEDEPEDGEEKSFWFSSQTWEDRNGSFEGGLFHEELELPLNFAQLDEFVSERLEKVSFVLPTDGMEDLQKKVYSEKISELLEAEDKVKSKWNADINVVDSKLRDLIRMDRLRFQNYANESLPISTLYEDGWWWIECWDTSCLLLEYEEDETIYKHNLLAALAEKFGRPSQISYYKTEDSFYDTLADNTGSLEYSMIYEYPGYVLEVQMYEEIYDDDTPSKAYVRGVRYYTEAGWEAYVKKTIGLYVFEVRK